MSGIESLTQRELRRLSRKDLLILLLEQTRQVETLEKTLRDERQAGARAAEEERLRLERQWEEERRRLERQWEEERQRRERQWEDERRQTQAEIEILRLKLERESLRLALAQAAPPPREEPGVRSLLRSLFRCPEKESARGGRRGYIRL